MQKRLKGEKKKVTKLVVLKISFFLPYSIGFIFCGIFSEFISLSREKSTLKHFSDLLTLLKSHYPTIFFCRQSMKRPGFGAGVKHFNRCSSIAVKLESQQDLLFSPAPPDICVQFHLKDPDTL